MIRDVVSYLPGRWRIRVAGAFHHLQEARLSLGSPPRPVCHSRNTADQLRQITEAWQALRAKAPQPPPVSTNSPLSTIPTTPLHSPVSHDSPTPTKTRGPFQVTFTHLDETIEVKADQTLLEAGLEAGLDLDFSCQMGGCGACWVTLLSGQVEMEEPNCLTEEEREEGACLACVSRPCSDLIIAPTND